jgi:hypothetical protein
VNWLAVFPIDYLEFGVAGIDVKLAGRPNCDPTDMSTKRSQKSEVRSQK